MQLSAVILAKNEATTIARAIRSVEFCDEIILVDDYSDDETIDIAKKRGARILKNKLNGDFAAQRNYGLHESRGDWVLYVDADEVVTEELKLEIIELLRNQTSKEAYYIKRRDWWWGRELKYGETRQARERGIVRLVHKGSGTWKSKVHETFLTGGNTGKLDGHLDHHPHSTVKEFLQEINFYSTLRAREIYDKGKKPSILDIIFTPFFKFIYTYFVLQGFRDGPAGFGYSFMMSFHSYLVRAKLYQYTVLDRK